MPSVMSLIYVPSLILSADTLDICRLAARRLSPSELDAEIVGDAALAEAVLVGLGAFALD